MARKNRSGSPGRVRQILDTYRATAKEDPALPYVLVGVFLGTLVVVGGLVWWLLNLATGIILGIGAAGIAATFVFGRRARRAIYGSIEGQPGAAAAVLNSLRGGWLVTPGVAVNKNQDLVHRVLGRPGVILVSEGPSSRAIGMLLNEKRKTQRYVGEIPVLEIQAGNEPGQVPLAKLEREVMKLPKVLRPAEVTELRRRLEAISSNPLPIPKGPLPKGMKLPKQPK